MACNMAGEDMTCNDAVACVGVCVGGRVVFRPKDRKDITVVMTTSVMSFLHRAAFSY